MNKSIKIKELEIGRGMPKICVSIIGKTKEDIIEAAKKYKTLDIDIIEWRADYYDEVEDLSKVKLVLAKLHDILDNKPIIFTFRSKNEGGEKEITKEKYFYLNKEVIISNLTDIIDIELFKGEDEVEDIIKYAQKNKVKVIVSNHDFKKTPQEDEMGEILEKMISLGADIPKIAVMPNNQEDVLKLLSVTSKIKTKYRELPIITMAMGSLGLITRLSGEVFGSAVTFGCLEQASAPGQLYYKELRNILSIIHKSK